MSLAKIPLALAVCWAFHKTITPPNPPPSRGDKRVKSNFMEMKWYTSRSPYYARTIQWLAGLAEVGTIVAYKYPSLPFSKIVLSTLVLKTGNPGALQLSTATTIGGISMVVGAFIRIVTYRELGKFFKFEASIQKYHQLITTGPYSIVRHPGYTALLFTHLGWFLWQFGEGSWLRESGVLSTAVGQSFVGTFTVLMIFGTLYLTLGRMHIEDAALRKHFGRQWDEWANKVRYRVIPGVW